MAEQIIINKITVQIKPDEVTENIDFEFKGKQYTYVKEYLPKKQILDLRTAL